MEKSHSFICLGGVIKKPSEANSSRKKAKTNISCQAYKDEFLIHPLPTLYRHTPTYANTHTHQSIKKAVPEHAAGTVPKPHSTEPRRHQGLGMPNHIPGFSSLFSFLSALQVEAKKRALFSSMMLLTTTARTNQLYPSPGWGKKYIFP